MPEKDFTVNYRGNDAGFGSTTNRVAAQLRLLGTQAGGVAGKELGALQQRLVGIFTLGFLEQKIQQSIEFADSMRSLADMTQIGVESLQALEYAAKQAGTPFSAVISAIKNIDRSRVSALAGNKPDVASFERLGVGIEQLKAQTAEQIFYRIADGIQQGNYSALQLNDTLNVMGRSANQLFPLFNAGLSDLASKARELGVIMDEDMINTLDAMGDQMDEMSARFRVGFGIIGGAIATVWNKLSQTLELVINFSTAFGTAWSGAKERLDNLVSAKGWMAAKEGYPAELKDSFRQAFDSVEDDYKRLIGTMGDTASNKGTANDQAEFAADRAQRASELRAKNDEKARDNQLKAMSVEARINELMKERLSLTEQLGTAQDELAREEIRSKLLDVNGKIDDAIASKPKPGGSQGIQRNLDELSRAGFFTGGRPTEIVDVAREQLSVLRQVARGIERVPAELDSIMG